MQVFINECSLNEQFNPFNLFEEIRAFLRTINTLNQFNDRKVFKSVMFFDYKAIKNTHIESSLKTNFELNSVFSQNLKNAINWEEEQVHDENSSYIFNEEEYVNTSIAEITERELTIPFLKAVLINFVDSKFAENRIISVQKNLDINANISCAFDETSIQDWLIQNGFINPDAEYDESSGLPPLDKQTVLANDQFEATQWRNGRFGRKVFKFKGTTQLWVVDGSSMHANNRAHIEVFDQITKKHIGTSLYNRIELDPKYIKKNRIINLV